MLSKSGTKAQTVARALSTRERVRNQHTNRTGSAVCGRENGLHTDTADLKRKLVGLLRSNGFGLQDSGDEIRKEQIVPNHEGTAENNGACYGPKEGNA